MRRTRSDDWYLDWPVFQGQGSASGVGPEEQGQHRFWHFRSVSRAAAIAYDRPKAEPARRIGFHRPRKP